MRRKLSGPPPRLKMPAGATDTQMHLYPEGFPGHPDGPPLPPGKAGVAEYEQAMDRLGIERVVVTQANAYQTDNAALVAVLRALGAKARGVAVVTPETSDQELERLHVAGVRGARIMDLAGGAVKLDGLAAVNARVKHLGWVLAVQFDGTHLLDHLPLLEAIEGNYIIDHHGKFFCGVTPDDPRVAAVKRLIDRGNCYFKLAGCYESSKAGPPRYEDVGAVAKAIVAHAPERVIWGTNWPHVMIREESAYPDDAALLDLLLEWAPEEEQRRLILAETPGRLFWF